MDVEKISDDLAWDRERLGDLEDILNEHGKNLSLTVIRNASSRIVQSIQSVEAVIPYLYSRGVLTLDSHHQLQEQPTKEKLCRLLVDSSSKTLGQGKDLIKNLYLALLDAFLSTYDRGCHSLAMILRNNAISSLQQRCIIPCERDVTPIDIVNGLPDVELQSPAASKLRILLKLPHYNEEITQLKLILAKTISKDQKLHDWLLHVVEAMMLTQGVGRFTTHLLPFHKSYSAEVFIIMLTNIGKKWTDFAFHLGFNSSEVDKIRYHSRYTVENEIKNFSKVWRMPDLHERTCYIIQRVMNEIKLNDPENCATASSPAITPGLRFQINFPAENKVSIEVESPQITKKGSLGRSSTSTESGRYRHYISQQKSSSLQSGSGEFVTSLDSEPPPNGSIDSGDVDIRSEISEPYLRELSNTVDEDGIETPSKPSIHPLAQRQRSIKQATSPALGYQDSKKACHPSLSVQPPYQQQTIPSPVQLQQSSVKSILPHFKPDEEITVCTNSIGNGLYGLIHSVQHGERQYAAKEYRIGDIDPIEFRRKMLELEHKNIVRYFEMCRIKDSKKVLVMEYVPHTLVSLCKEIFKSESKVSILAQVADGLAYLHSHGIIHSDLIPSNILIQTQPPPTNYIAKISDYANSLAMPIFEAIVSNHQVHSRVQNYLSPEASAGEISTKSDVFSYGHIILYIVLQQEPHPLKKPKEGKLVRTEVERREEFFVKMATMLEESDTLVPLVDWAKECLDDDEDVRPEIKQFCERFSVYIKS